MENNLRLDLVECSIDLIPSCDVYLVILDRGNAMLGSGGSQIKDGDLNGRIERE